MCFGMQVWSLLVPLIKGQANQRVQSTSVPQQGPFSNNLPHSAPSVEPELPAPNSIEKQSPAKSTKSNPLSAYVAPVLGDLMEEKKLVYKRNMSHKGASEGYFHK